LHAHWLFVPKYRRRVISKRVFNILEAHFEPGHVHLLVEYPPKLALSRLVNSLKGVSARRLRAADLPEIREKLSGAHFWSPSYCAVSCGGAPFEIVNRYVERRRGASSPP